MDTIEIRETVKTASIFDRSHNTYFLNHRLTTTPTPLLSLPSHNEEPQQQQVEKLLSSSSSLDLPSTLSDLNANSNVLHEAVVKKFNRTSSGKLYKKDIKDIFAMLIVSLQLSKSLSSSAKNKSTLLPLLKFRLIPKGKKYPYSFQLLNAIDQMTHLRVEIDLSNIVTCLSYSFQPEIASTLINQFFKAKFLHSPADRTRSVPKHDVWLQPTPKGLSIVQSFCEKVGMKKLNMPDILLQNSYNSMHLFYFDRDPVTDEVIYSRSLINLLFTRLLGPIPNIWSPMNKPDPIPSVIKRSDEVFGKGVEVVSHGKAGKKEGLSISVTPSSKPADPFSFLEYQRKTLKLFEVHGDDTFNQNVSDVSPYHHRYFLNPESDAHMQYYVSSVGVRLYKAKNLDGFKTTNALLSYRISGKAIVQWLMDCTDIVRPKHAMEIANLFLNQRFITPFGASDARQLFQIEQHYQLGDKGLSLCMWGKASGIKTGHLSFYKQNPCRLEVTLDTIMQDPGLRFQFKCHLEQEFCLENFDAYCQLQVFKENVKLWNDIRDSGQHTDDDILSKQNIQHQTSLRDTCMSIAYQIYNTYISHESPFVLNIDYNLRLRVVKLLTRLSNDMKCHKTNLDAYMQTPTDESSSEQLGASYENLRAPSREKLATDKEEEREIDLNQVLQKLTVFFDEVSAHLYRMMEGDSLPKFLNSLDKV